MVALNTLQDEHGLRHYHTVWWWSRKGLQILESLDFKTVDGVLSSLHRRNSSLKFVLSVGFRLLGLVGNCIDVLSLDVRGILFLLRISGLKLDLRNQFVGGSGLNFNLNHLDFKKLLQVRHLISRRVHNI